MPLIPQSTEETYAEQKYDTMNNQYISDSLGKLESATDILNKLDKKTAIVGAFRDAKDDDLSGYIMHGGYVTQPEATMTYTTPRTDDARQKFAVDLDKVLYSIASFLTEKNDSYGDSALNPKRIFSQASAREAINVRLDDKLSRLINGSSVIGDNDKKDILGYLILDQIAELREKENVQG